MKRVALLFDPDIDQGEIETAMNAAGLMLRAIGGEIYVDRVPPFIRKDPPANDER